MVGSNGLTLNRINNNTLSDANTFPDEVPDGMRYFCGRVVSIQSRSETLLSKGATAFGGSELT